MPATLTCFLCGAQFERKKIDPRNRRSFCSSECFQRQSQIDQSDEYTTYKYMYSQASNRAKKKSINFDITIDDIRKLWITQEGKCSLTGVDLSFGSTSNEQRSGVNTASLDRKDSYGGYTVDNVQIVHKIINQMKFNLDEQVFKYWCRRVADHAILDEPLACHYNDSVDFAENTPF